MLARRRGPERVAQEACDTQQHHEGVVVDIAGLNLADLLERYLQDDGHQTWGFMIYRSTYSSDANWAGFLQRLRSGMEDAFNCYNSRDML